MEKPKRRNRFTMNINMRLPPNIIEVIFSKLLIFNLPICRLVCNDWNDLILNYCIDFNPNYLGGISFVASLGSQDYLLRSSSIMCSCNGLLLIYTSVKKLVSFDIFKLTIDEYHLDILNPMTNEYLRIPEEENSYYHYYHPQQLNFYSYGFGFSLKTKRYKVVRVLKPFKPFGMHTNFEVFTFGGSNNQWRSYVEDVIPFSIHMNDVYFNGALYWIGLAIRRYVVEYFICCFDLENERIKSIISLPIVVPPISDTLELFNDSVYATFLFNDLCYKIEVWRMQNCGSEDSWAREFVVKDMPKDWMMPLANTYFQFIKCYEDEEILCLINGRFSILYNPKYGSIKILNKFEQPPSLSESLCRLDSFSFHSLQKILAGDDG